MSDTEDYCKDKSAPDGSSLYYASLYESKNNKHLIFILFALHYELFDCLGVSPDPGVTRLKLHWWHEELGRLSTNNPRHPVSIALLPIVNANSFVMEYLNQHYLSIESLLNTQSELSTSEWKAHWCTALGQLWLCAENLTGKSDNNPQIMRNGGIIFILDILQNFYLLSSKLPDFLPADLLDKYELDSESLKQTQRQVDVCNLFSELLMGIQAELNILYYKMKKQEVKTGLYHVIMNRIACSLCNEIHDDGNHIMHHKIAITPLRKLWISWRTKLLY